LCGGEPAVDSPACLLSLSTSSSKRHCGENLRQAVYEMKMTFSRVEGGATLGNTRREIAPHGDRSVGVLLPVPQVDRRPDVLEAKCPRPSVEPHFPGRPATASRFRLWSYHVSPGFGGRSTRAAGMIADLRTAFGTRSGHVSRSRRRRPGGIPRLAALFSWARMDSNHRPTDYESAALTS
jgi:hypothetical protein